MGAEKTSKSEDVGELKDKLTEYIESEAKKLVIDEHNLNEEFMYQAQNSVRANIRASQAAALVSQSKTELDEVISQIDGEIRSKDEDEPAEGKEKKKAKLTEAMLSNLIKLDPRYKSARDKLNKAERQANIYKDIARAYEHKKDMLIQLGSMTRAEMDATIRLKNRQENDPDLSPTAKKGGAGTKPKYERL